MKKLEDWKEMTKEELVDYLRSEEIKKSIFERFISREAPFTYFQLACWMSHELDKVELPRKTIFQVTTCGNSIRSGEIRLHWIKFQFDGNDFLIKKTCEKSFLEFRERLRKFQIEQLLNEIKKLRRE